jgi:lipopolysaccharide/colanic/teichoic acid biosynthesis glycosyltransferase
MASPAFIQYRHEEALLALWNTHYSTGQAAAGGDLEDIYLTAILPDKLRLDLEYIEQQSFLGDLAILAQAAISLFTTASPEQRSGGAREQRSKGEQNTGS